LGERDADAVQRDLDLLGEPSGHPAERSWFDGHTFRVPKQRLGPVAVW
jgi:hypothetical protein